MGRVQHELWIGVVFWIGRLTAVLAKAGHPPGQLGAGFGVFAFPRPAQVASLSGRLLSTAAFEQGKDQAEIEGDNKPNQNPQQGLSDRRQFMHRASR